MHICIYTDSKQLLRFSNMSSFVYMHVSFIHTPNSSCVKGFSNKKCKNVDKSLMHYSFISEHSVSHSQFQWNLVPKHNYFWHLAMQANDFNPRMSWCSGNENFVGRVATIGMSCRHGQVAASRSKSLMQKYILGIILRMFHAMWLPWEFMPPVLPPGHVVTTDCLMSVLQLFLCLDSLHGHHFVHAYTHVSCVIMLRMAKKNPQTSDCCVCHCVVHISLCCMYNELLCDIGACICEGGSTKANAKAKVNVEMPEAKAKSKSKSKSKSNNTYPSSYTKVKGKCKGEGNEGKGIEDSFEEASRNIRRRQRMYPYHCFML